MFYNVVGRKREKRLPEKVGGLPGQLSLQGFRPRRRQHRLRRNIRRILHLRQRVQLDTPRSPPQAVHVVAGRKRKRDARRRRDVSDGVAGKRTGVPRSAPAPGAARPHVAS
jgi:hypothetical protein